MPNTNILRKIVFPGITYDPDAQILFDRMVIEPTNARKLIINALIVGLKNDGNWNELDVLVILAAADSQASLLDFKNLQDGALVNAPAFEADRGVTGNGSTSYINAQFNLTTDAVQYTRNNASAGIYTRTNVGGNNLIGMGLTNATIEGLLIAPRNASSVATMGVNTNTFKTYGNADSRGLYSIRRTTNNAQEAFKNGLSKGAQADASIALVNDNVYVLCFNRIDTGAGGFSIRQKAMYFLGSGDINQLTFYNRIQTYMTAIGANV